MCFPESLECHATAFCLIFTCNIIFYFPKKLRKDVLANLVQNLTLNSQIIEASWQVTTDIGKGRCWLRLALNDGLLGAYLLAIQKDRYGLLRSCIWGISYETVIFSLGILLGPYGLMGVLVGSRDLVDKSAQFDKVPCWIRRQSTAVL